MIELYTLIVNGASVKSFLWNNGQINALLGAALYIATVGNKYELSTAGKQTLQLLSFFLLSTEINIDNVEIASPVELAATFQDNEQKKSALEFLVLAAYSIDAHIDEKNQLLDGYLRSLKLSDLLLKQLFQIYNQYRQLVEYNEFRKQSQILKNDEQSERFVQNDNRQEIEEYYKKMTLLSRNTLGYNLYKSYRKNKFPLPGEYLLSSEKLVMVFDIMKLIAGYRYDTRGDLNTLSYMAGNLVSGSFIVAGIAVIEYYYYNLESIKQINKLERKKFWNNLKAGMNCQLDLTSGWDYVSNYGKSLTQLRGEFNLI